MIVEGKMERTIVCMALLMLLSTVVAADTAPERTVVYDRVATRLTSVPPAVLSQSPDLWITLADLTRATKFVLKPQGVCRDELCFPIPRGRREAFLSRQGKTSWFNLSEFARLLHQPTASDAEHAVWYFGPRPAEQNSHIASLMAPDFTLQDMAGRSHSLKDFRGKKVLLLTWASW